MKIEITLADTMEVNMPELKIGIIADSHGHPATITDALAYLVKRKCGPIIKAITDNADEIRPCVGCSQGCEDEVFSGRPVFCVGNARAGIEGEHKTG